jgi:glutamate racemase
MKNVREFEKTMDMRPIGVFDSGLGGLTAVRSLRQILPEENLIYFGDTARVPYGGRARETILKYARQDVRFLRSFDLKAIVIACGTVSTTSLDTLQAENDLPIVGVVEPTCRRALLVTKNKKVGMIATLASVRSGAYEAALRRLDPEVEVFCKPCPLFVPLVENGRIQRGDVVIETVAREYLEPLRETGIDTLILGCTHYPLLTAVIADVMGPGVTLVSAGEESAFELKRLLKAEGLRADEKRQGESEFYVSDQTEDFERIASVFLQEDLRHAARRIDIDQY